MIDKSCVLTKLKDKHVSLMHREPIKSFSERPRKKEEGGWAGKGQESIPEAIGYMVMKEKFDSMYRHIERLTMQQELLVKSMGRQVDFQRNASIDLAPPETTIDFVHI